MNKVIPDAARDIIYKVFLRCFAEFQSGCLLSNLEDIYKRTADFTGVSESSVRRIAMQGSKNDGNFSTPAKHRTGRPRKQVDIDAIREKIQLFYTINNEAPTIRKLLAELREDMIYDGSREHLRKLLKKNGFSFEKCKTNKKVLKEKPTIAHKRETYEDVEYLHIDLQE